MATSSRRERTNGEHEIVPRGEKRRGQLVVVAERVFLAHGYVDTTMQMVATEAGASKATLYRFFGSKEELFANVMDHGTQALRDRLTANLTCDESLSKVLTEVGTVLLETITRPATIALLRTILTAAPREPTLGQIFHTRCPGQTLKDLTEYLTRARTRGEFRGTDPALAADIFLGSVAGLAHLKYLTLIDLPPLTQSEIQTHITEVVGMFLWRYSVQ